MAEPDINGPLVNEPAREAVDSMRGYSAQVWRSVLVWLDLADLERLYLEGAEDIDRIHATVAETIQVKNFRGNVTLRSKDVVAAIDNAWSHQERNPGRSIRFRFLTTAGIGLEQGDPFGNAIPGLELWSRARASNDDSARLCSTAKLKKFLVAEERVFAPLQAFLRVADDAAVWQRLISVIDWDTEADEVPEVVREIKDRLVVLGQSYGVPPADAEKVAADLYEFAWTTATREKDRYLTRAILLRAFCEKTHRSIPQATLGALLAVQQILQAPNRELGAPPIAVGGSSGIIGRPPPLPLRYFVRVDVLADIGCVLAGHSAVVLQGSTGAGKSTLAAGHVTDALAIWGWVDLRGLDGAGLARRLGEIAKDLATEEGLANLTLDDFEIPSDPRPLSAPLARIRMLIRARGGALVITSSQVLPQRLWLALELSPESTLQVRPFTRDDIKAFLAVRGCPEPDPASSWAGIIYLHTQGHAQLVHARIAALEASGFPVPGPLDLTDTPPDVLEARAEGRRLLTTLDSEARSLVYRLSLTVHALQRPQVLAIANQPPAIAEPGLALDRLVGPWLETVVDGFYRVSPLVRDAGMQILGQDWAEAMHGSITRALLGFRTLSPIDVSMVLFHGIAAKDWAALAHLSRGILNSDDATFDALASTAGWFVHVGIGIGAVRPTADEYSLVLIRMLQYRLAAADKDHHTAAAIIDCVDAEIPPVSGNRGLQILRHLFLGHVLIRTEVQLPVSRVLSIGREYAQLSDSLGELRAPLRAEKLDPVMRGPNGEFDIGMIASFALALRISDRTALSDLLQVCDPLDPMEVRRLLWFIGNREPVAWAMFERVRLSESKSATADWVACSSVCIRAYNFARRLSLAGLAQSAARAIAEITDVNLHDPDDALRLADAMAAEIGWSPSQEDGRASILLRRGDPAGALAIWRRVIPEWGPWDKFDSRQTFSCREAAIAAAQLEKWAEAADLLTAARERVQTGSDPIYEVGLLMDEGYARWMAGDNRTALARLAAGLSALEHLPSDDADERAFALRTRAGHALMWIAANAEGAPPKGYSAPPPGC